MDLKQIAVNSDKEKDGVWVEMDEDTSLLIGRLNSPQYTRIAEQLRKPYRRQIENGSLSVKKRGEIAAGIYAKTVLLDWKGLKIDGKIVPYSEKKCKEILSDDQYQPFWSIVSGYATDEELFRQGEIEKISGEQ